VSFLTVETFDMVLFLDEVNALLGKRTEVGGARNRYAILKEDYLHQRIEECKGIVLLAANIR
jgi:hypothetical protein